MRFSTLAAFGLVAVLGQSAQAAPVVIDYFDPDKKQEAALPNGGVGGTESLTPMTAVFGDSFDFDGDTDIDANDQYTRSGAVTLNNFDFPEDDQTTATLVLGTAAGLETHGFIQQGSGDPRPSSSFYIEYTGFGGTNFNALGDALVLSDLTRSGSQEPFTITITVNGIHSVTFAFPSTGNSTTIAAAGFLFSAFAPNAFDSVDSLRIEGSVVGDTFSVNASKLSIDDGIEFDPLNPVPEPSSLALAGMALVGFGGYVRRKVRARV